jgi:hypothetical protein
MLITNLTQNLLGHLDALQVRNIFFMERVVFAFWIKKTRRAPLAMHVGMEEQKTKRGSKTNLRARDALSYAP